MYKLKLLSRQLLSTWKKHQYHMEDDDPMPSLDDFEEDLKSVTYFAPKNTTTSQEDYTQTNLRHIEDQAVQQK